MINQRPASEEDNAMFIEWNAEQTEFSVWDAERIRNAFSFGNGTMEDFKRYMRDNKHKKFEKIK